MLLDADVQAGLVVDRTGALRGSITVDDIAALMREARRRGRRSAGTRRERPADDAASPDADAA